MVAQLVDSLNQAKIDEQTEVVVSPTFVHLQHVLEHLRPPITVAAQNCWVNGTGAYTGEVRRAAGCCTAWCRTPSTSTCTRVCRSQQTS